MTTLTKYAILGTLGVTATIILYQVFREFHNSELKSEDSLITCDTGTMTDNTNTIQPVNNDNEGSENEESENEDHGETKYIHSLFVGCNYPDTDSALNGCVPDARSIFNIFNTYSNMYPKFKKPVQLFDEETDDFSKTMVMNKLRDMYLGCKSGETFFLYFSGHGIQIKDDDGDEKRDSKDECCLITCNKNESYQWLLDDDLNEFFSRKDVKFVFLLDCCHSGGMSDIVRNRKNNLVISACTEDQTSKEISIGSINNIRGIFTYNLEKVLKESTEGQSIQDIGKSSIWNDIDGKYKQTFTVWGNSDIFKFPSLQ